MDNTVNATHPICRAANAREDASRTSESVIKVLRNLIEIVGNSALVRQGSSAELLMGDLEYEVRAATTLTFGGGTNEIQRELIAQFGLHMPRAVR
jgi:alkylation response protein AidB-like acyl-CoA dehydrogenase